MKAFRRRQDSYRWHWADGCSNYPTEVEVMICGTVPDYGIFCDECEALEEQNTVKLFRRRQNSLRWHWADGCSNYPTEIDVMISRTEPEYGIFCEECKENYV